MKSNSRKKINFVASEVVVFKEERFRISEVIDFESIVVESLNTGRSQVLKINDLTSSGDSTTPSIEIGNIKDKDWKKAIERYNIIKPLLESGTTSSDISDQAEDVNRGYTTLYRWLKLFKEAGSIDGLIPQKRGAKNGNYHLEDKVEEIIKNVIDTIYMNKNRYSIKKVIKNVITECKEQGFKKIPSKNTIRLRIYDIPEYKRLKARGQREKASNLYDPASGKFPNANYPLACVQIDHTPVDIILVDDVHREPIEKVWLTLAMDVYSRMVTGFYLSCDAPSVTSVAMCVAHSILKKDDWLRSHNIDEQWPVWGVMTTIHVDNGSDFRSKDFNLACQLHNINLDYRPVKVPKFGGHIERLLGTFMTATHDLPGTTFSNISERKGYDSEKNSAMTISEYEEWLSTYICTVYHKDFHEGIEMTPLRKWELGVFGDNNDIDGSGLPALPKNKRDFLLDFMPTSNRTVQRNGISIDKISYYSDVLRNWINSKDKDNIKIKMKFIFRRDPRDISCIWFYDPNLLKYYKIPYADHSLPKMSIWDLRKIKAILKEEGIKSYNENDIIRAYKKLDFIVNKAIGKTKKARRESQKQKTRKNKSEQFNKQVQQEPVKVATVPDDVITDLSDLFDDENELFGDIS